ETPRRYAPMGGSLAPIRVAGFTWNGWQPSAVYAIPGYTPLMLAIESDELDLVNRMVSAGGILEKTYLDQNSGKWVTPLQIATEFQAHSVLKEVFGKG
ncbi:hypothetical protein, partial [Marinobacter sp.]